ncbi:hypothetical protein N7475_005243 [Penicillium sp. IBT 31633x]|nr:hypothetical protein N7475_005243 [Penicillium sp. IBT 31633x]
MDLLSSTSEEVCEIWNGRGATRKLAPVSHLPVTEWIFDGTLMASKEAKNHVLVMKEPLDIAAPMSAVKKGTNGLYDWQEKAETELPPNIVMNLGPYDRVWKLFLLTTTGIFLQLSILTLAALTSFYCPVRPQFFARTKEGYRITAFTFVMTGTVLLSSGLLYTAKTIDTSARVDVWKPTKQGMMVIWKQNETNNEVLRTDSYVIGKMIKKELISSHRRSHTCPSTSMSLPVAIAITLGFLIQSVGISLMHWPTQALQLLSMIIMFLGRCYARSQDPPDFVKKFEHNISKRELLELAQEWRYQKLCSENGRS